MSLADSWLLSDGRVRRIDLHRQRFLRGCAEVGSVSPETAAAFWQAALGTLPLKGPDLDALGALRGRAVERGAQEALLTTESGVVLEGGCASVLWWDGDRLCVPSPELRDVVFTRFLNPPGSPYERLMHWTGFRSPPENELIAELTHEAGLALAARLIGPEQLTSVSSLWGSAHPSATV
ncbi:hypothetical protein RM550_16510 [Streptomyces sp. DSM 41527]|uniref:Aminotransferase class IV n=1 Tax=Streptomyces mooreae TaxID=3075523 RepID=A0ABU2T8S0_9ACTN|nr:aminotransferase class IV [Streptomyces sp. DSM 41527]MDT0457323.1 hypothetical protein [Streptomyces sp. DSM 41527]